MSARLAFVLAAALAAFVPAGSALAEGTLEGRTVTFTVLTYDDPAQPMLEASGRTVTVGQGVEFGLEPEGTVGGLDVVPVEIEITPTRLEAFYRVEPGRFYTSAFNGYVLIFETECALFDKVEVDRDFTNMDIRPGDVRAEFGRLFVNVSGKDYGPDKRFALNFSVADCPLS